jgi:microcystin-dependent protein
MSDAFLGEIRMLSWNYPPRYWAFCDGTTMAINQNQALFALLGTTYGGNGVTTYQLPDLRSRAPMGMGGPTGGNAPGTTGGVANFALGPNQVPSHTHQLMGTTAKGTTATMVAGTTIGGFNNAYGPNPGIGEKGSTTFPPVDVYKAGGSLPHENRQPFLVINFAIALSGIFPSRT